MFHLARVLLALGSMVLVAGGWLSLVGLLSLRTDIKVCGSAAFGILIADSVKTCKGSGLEEDSTR